MVQFARDKDGGDQEVAIKFFLRKEDHAVEERLYEHASIRKTLPKLLVSSDNASGRLQSGRGMPFPPFMVMERGCKLAMCDSPAHVDG